MINKKIQKIIAMGIITTTMLIPIKANAEWKQDSKGWWYTEGNSYAKDGWRLINNNWYYFDSNGYMKTGWIQDTNSKWYYLSQDGSMLANTVTPDGYTLNIDGTWNTSIPKTENKQIATAPVVENANNNSNTNNSTVEENTENNTVEESSSTTKTKKRRSSSSSSSSSSNNNSSSMFPIDNGKEQWEKYKDYTTDEKGMCVMNLLYNPNNLRIEIMGTGLGSSQKGLYVLHFDVRDYGYKNYESMNLIDIINTTKLKNENGKVTIDYMIKGNDMIDWDKYKNKTEKPKEDTAISTDDAVKLN